MKKHSQVYCALPLSLLIRNFILFTSFLLLAVVLQAEGQINKTRPACYSNSGDLSVPITMRLPYTASRTFSSISYVYRSSQGWSLNIPSIIEKTDQTLLYDRTYCVTTVYFDPQKGLYFLSSGGWLAPLSGGGFAYLKGSGERAEFTHPVTLPNGDTKWLLTGISNRFGWRTVYRYDSLDRLYKIEVDGYYRVSRSQSAPYDRTYSLENAPKFYVNLSYDGNTSYLSEVTFSTDKGVVLSSYKIIRDPNNKDLVNKIDIYGKNNTFSESYTFNYYTGGDFDGLMSSLVLPLGGTISYSYEKKRIFWVDTGAFAGYRAVLSVVQSDPDVPDQDVRIATFSYKYGLLSQDFFYGFKEISDYRGGGIFGGETHKYDNASLDTAGRAYEAFLFDSNGIPFAKRRSIYTTGGYNNHRYATKRVINISGVPDLSSPAKTATVVDLKWDADLDKLLAIHDRGLVGIDPITDQIDTSLYVDDDLHILLTYLNDAPLYDEYELTKEISYRDENYVEYQRMGYRYTDDFLISSTYVKNFPFGDVKELSLEYDKYGNTLYRRGPSKTIKFEWEDDGYFLNAIIDDPDGKKFVTWFRRDPDTYLTSGITSPDGKKIKYYFDDTYKLTEAKIISKDGSEEDVTLKVTTSPTDPRLSHIEANGTTVSIYSDGLGNPIKKSMLDAYSGLMSTALAYNSGGYIKRSISAPFQSSSEVYQAGDAINNPGVTYGYDSYGQLTTLTPDIQGDGLGAKVLSRGAKGLFGAPPFNPLGDTTLLPSGRKMQSGWFGNTTYRIIGDELANEQEVFSITKDTLSTTLADNNQANVVKLKYDSEGRVISNQINSNPPQTAEFEENKEIITYPSGKKMISYYDSIGRLSKLVHEDPSTGESYTYEYFWDEGIEMDLYVPKGELAGISGPFDKVSYGYDLFGRLVVARHSVMDLTGSVDDKGNPTYTTLEFRFEYDPIFQKVSKIIYPSVDGAEVEISYLYDANGREKAIVADKFVNGLSNTTLRTIDSRDQKRGFITQATYSQGLIESYQYSPASGALIEKKLMNSKKLNQPLTIERTEYTNEHLTKRELIVLSKNGQYTKGTIEFKDYDSRNYPRKMVKTIETGGNVITEEEPIAWDEQGRMVAELLKKDVNILYKDGSNHPYQPDGVKYGDTVYPWTYDVDGQVIQRTGPEAKHNMTLEYGPDRKVRKVIAQNGNVIWFRQSIFGSIVERESYDSAGNLIEAYREFLGGLVQQSYQGNEWQTTYNIFGESEYGVPDVVIAVKYPAVIQTFGGGTGTGPDTPPPPPPPPPPEDPNNPLCGNNKIDPGEQCDGSIAGCPPGTLQCTSKCLCDRKAEIVLMPRMLGGINGDTLELDLDEEQVKSLIYHWILYDPCRFEELFNSLGVDICDQNAFGDLVPNLNLLLSEEFQSLVMLVVSNRALLMRAAQIIGLRAEAQYGEYVEEVAADDAPPEEEESTLDKVQEALDVASNVDIVAIPAAAIGGPGGLAVAAVCEGISVLCSAGSAAIDFFKGEWGDGAVTVFLAVLPGLPSLKPSAVKRTVEGAKSASKKALKPLARAGRTLARKVKYLLGYRFKGTIRFVIGTWPEYLRYSDKAIVFFITKEEMELLKAAGKTLEDLNAQFIELVSRLVENKFAKVALAAEEDLSEMRYITVTPEGEKTLRLTIQEVAHLRGRTGVEFGKKGTLREGRIPLSYKVRRRLGIDDTPYARSYFDNLFGADRVKDINNFLKDDITNFRFPDVGIKDELFKYLRGPKDMVGRVRSIAEDMGWVD